MTHPRVQPVRRNRLTAGLQFRPFSTGSSKEPSNEEKERVHARRGEREREREREGVYQTEFDFASQILLAMYVKWKRRLVVRRRNGIIIVARFGAASRFLIHR